VKSIAGSTVIRDSNVVDAEARRCAADGVSMVVQSLPGERQLGGTPLGPR